MINATGVTLFLNASLRCPLTIHAVIQSSYTIDNVFVNWFNPTTRSLQLRLLRLLAMSSHGALIFHTSLLLAWLGVLICVYNRMLVARS